jgi:hypothetical protein
MGHDDSKPTGILPEFEPFIVMLLEYLFCLPLSVFPIFGIEGEQRIPLFGHATK